MKHDLALTRRTATRLQKTPPGLGQIFFVDFEADELLHVATLCSDPGIPDSEKRIDHGFGALYSVKLDAPSGERARERRGMRPIFRPPLNGFVRDKPGVSSAPAIFSFGVAPASDVAL